MTKTSHTDDSLFSGLQRLPCFCQLCAWSDLKVNRLQHIQNSLAHLLLHASSHSGCLTLLPVEFRIRLKLACLTCETRNMCSRRALLPTFDTASFSAVWDLPLWVFLILDLASIVMSSCASCVAASGIGINCHCYPLLKLSFFFQEIPLSPLFLTGYLIALTLASVLHNWGKIKFT